MLIGFALYLLVSVEPASPLAVTITYLQALARLDAEAMQRVRTLSAAEQARSQDNRDFERATHTKWTWRVIGLQGTAVHVLETEDNDFYELLGVGTATQIGVYHVDGNRILSAEIVYRTHANGDQRAAVARFIGWLARQSDGHDPVVVRNDELVFNGRSAKGMIALLRRWRAEGRPYS